VTTVRVLHCILTILAITYDALKIENVALDQVFPPQGIAPAGGGQEILDL